MRTTQLLAGVVTVWALASPAMAATLDESAITGHTAGLHAHRNRNGNVQTLDVPYGPLAAGGTMASALSSGTQLPGGGTLWAISQSTASMSEEYIYDPETGQFGSAMVLSISQQASAINNSARITSAAEAAVDSVIELVVPELQAGEYVGWNYMVIIGKAGHSPDVPLLSVSGHAKVENVTRGLTLLETSQSFFLENSEEFVALTALSGDVIRITFQGQASGAWGNNTSVNDRADAAFWNKFKIEYDVAYVPPDFDGGSVPEPATFVLAAIGLGGLVVRRASV